MFLSVSILIKKHTHLLKNAKMRVFHANFQPRAYSLRTTAMQTVHKGETTV